MQVVLSRDITQLVSLNDSCLLIALPTPLSIVYNNIYIIYTNAPITTIITLSSISVSIDSVESFS